MRVLHVVCSDRFAGVERHVALLAGAQQRAGATVAVIGGDERSMRRDIGRDDVIFRATGGLVQTIRTARPFVPEADVVHVHMTASEVAGVIAAWGTTAAVVTTRHFADPRGSTPLNRWVGRRAAARIDAQIAVSAYAARYVEGASTVVHAGVRDRPSVDPGSRQPVVLARATPGGGEAVRRRHRRLRRLAAGGARLAAGGRRRGFPPGALERQAARLGLSGAVTFLGHAADVGRLMSSAGILIAPRPDEAYGLSVVEAMAAGLPVVAAAGGGHLETVGTVSSAALFPPGDAVAAGALLTELADDTDGRASYGDALRDVQRSTFTLEAQERATDAVYRSLL